MPERLIPGNRVQLLHDGDECLSALRAAILGAEREVLVEMYWFGSDKTGRAFAELLGEKARRGVRVCVTYDAAGSFGVDQSMFAALAAAGAGVYEYHPVSLLRRRFELAALNRRNHRKLVLIDGRLGFTGGLNLADPWASVASGGLGFRDDLVAIEGPVLRVMRDIFLGTYRGPLRDEALADPLGSDRPVGPSEVRVLATDRRRNRRLIERAYLDRIRNARQQILITNCYFIPSRAVRRALVEAAQRGVQVRVLLPGISDVPAVLYATRRLYTFLLERGVELYEWHKSILHAKTAVIDGLWCNMGTYNLDHRSLAYNLEINVLVKDTEVAAALERRMQSDIDASPRVDLRAWRYRPIGQRLLELLFFLLRKAL